MKYTIITQRCGCHILVEALLRSIHRYLTPDEIIVSDGGSLGHPKLRGISEQLHEEILKAKNDYILMVDQDILFFDNSLIEEMISHITRPNVFAVGAFTHDYKVPGIPQLLVASCNMLNKTKYLEGVTFNKTSKTEPCVEPFSVAFNKGMELVILDPRDRVFHLNSGFHWTYADLVLGDHWQRMFNTWKARTGSKQVLEDYVVDDGMDEYEVCGTTVPIVEIMHSWWLCSVRPFSLLNITETDLNYIEDYYAGRLDATHTRLVEDLLGYIKSATHLTHPHLYRGLLGEPPNLPDIENRYNNLYSKLGVKPTQDDVYRNRFCLPDQGFFFLVDKYSSAFYKFLVNKRVMYVGKNDDLGELNKRKNLGLVRYHYEHMESASDVNHFLGLYTAAEWDLVITSTDFYGNIVAGYVRSKGKMAVNLGGALSFTLNDTNKNFLSVSPDKTSYGLIDSYKNYGKRIYESYLK